MDSLSAPGWADTPPQDLTPASRRQDHTTSPSASAPFVCAPSSLTALIPPCEDDCAPTLPRPSHPEPHVRDDRETPLKWAGMARLLEMFLGIGKAENFSRKHWTRLSLICPPGQRKMGRTLP